MKTVHAALIAMIAAGLSLTACGEEKKAEPAKAEPAKTAPAEPAQAEPVKAETQTDVQADAAKPEQAAEQTANTTEQKTTDATDAAAKTEMVKPASLAVGQKRYETTCKMCHDAGLLDAPKLSDKAGWAKRAEQGVETLYKHSAQGYNKMPAQVIGDVTEAEVYAAVDYMLSQAK
ncbi:c-type cytochrome [Moraxella sp. FZLJ2107]|uniref:c-type cytochrome n=1 Tax=unclassified Moraxella TaxID=2685852 RepID=UPI0020C9168A|nr:MULTISPECIES: c-type cytochrome [unclassified Moraxella]UTO04089.1 c-type cytochrome [Moraxella sp. FZLJ2107]UTO22921.1 c-type cytochrome [Moraxella sp. FZLJ2109]